MSEWRPAKRLQKTPHGGSALQYQKVSERGSSTKTRALTLQCKAQPLTMNNGKSHSRSSSSSDRQLACQCAPNCRPLWSAPSRFGGRGSAFLPPRSPSARLRSAALGDGGSLAIPKVHQSIGAFSPKSTLCADAHMHKSPLCKKRQPSQLWPTDRAARAKQARIADQFFSYTDTINIVA